MTKQGDWSEAETRLCRQERTGSRPGADVFEEEDGTVLEPPDAIAARAYASVVLPEPRAQRPQLPLPPSLRQALSGAPGSAPRVPRVATPLVPASIPYLTTRVPTPRTEAAPDSKVQRRMLLTPLPPANAASIPVPPLAPISRQAPLAPARAHRPEIARYRFIGVLALTGLVLGIAVFQLARAMF
jgi:hypothetical protein